MSFKNIYAETFGWGIDLTVAEDGVAQDISSYTTLQYVFEDPYGNTTPKTVSFKTDGSNGVLTYTVEDGLHTRPGQWSVHYVIAKSGAEIVGEPQYYSVKRRIGG